MRWKVLVAIVSWLSFLSMTSIAADEEVILKVSANGKRNLQPFTVKDRWEVRWDAKDRLSIWIHGMGGDALEHAASQLKAGSGTSFQPKGGQYYLAVNGAGDWTITVVQLP